MREWDSKTWRPRSLEGDIVAPESNERDRVKDEEEIGRGEWTRTDGFLPLLPSGVAVRGVDQWLQKQADAS